MRAEKARILLIGKDSVKIDDVCKEIIRVTEKTGVDFAGPVPLPTKKMKITTMKSPDGEGTSTWERWEMRIHKRLIDVEADERSLRQIMRVQVPDGVHIEIELPK